MITVYDLESYFCLEGLSYLTLNDNKDILVQDKITQLLIQIQSGNYKALARGITMVENELGGYNQLLKQLKYTNNAKVIGITGPPGAGKSTLVNALLTYWTKQKKKVAVIAVDPSSPFNYGALLGDRIRMSDFYTNPNVYIRSLATRGALGGLNPKIIEITDLVKNAGFDHILVETVGVGQSEVEIAGLADCTVVTLVPEAGDEIQTIKAGIMEIADIFVVNKADRENADGLYRSLKILAHERATDANETKVVKTIASKNNGIEDLVVAIDSYLTLFQSLTEKRIHLLTEKCWQLVQDQRMKVVNKKILKKNLEEVAFTQGFNLYSFVHEQIQQINNK